MNETQSNSDNHIPILNGDQVPCDWGEQRKARRKTIVSIREPNGIETFVKSWGTLTATPCVDWIIVQDDGEEYPIKKDIFATTYEEATPGRYRKTAHSRLVQVPKGIVAVLVTSEGELEVHHPDYVVIGAENEVDLLIERGAGLVAVECKVTERPTASDVRGIMKLTDFYGNQAITAAFIACTADQPFMVTDKVLAQSGWSVWELNG